ncbi:peptidase E [Nocardioides marinquilinus]|uniref:Peptidase E n=1 Tax=Nocardioides marinquilinus TaxID=1210400 RepID=A0ABP9PNY7_9ACTN
MKLLLTSGGVTNPSIELALVDLLGNPVAECRALAIPTATYAHPWCTPEHAFRFVTGEGPGAMTNLGWASVGVLELTALPSLDRERWEGWVREADVLLVGGGDVLYLAHWLRESGLADLLPDLDDVVWVGLSAGSMVLAPRVGHEFTQWHAPGADPDDDTTLGLVDVAIFPHLAPDGQPGNSMAEAEQWAASIGHDAYALDDAGALVVVEGEVTVVSDGAWRFFAHSASD